MRVALGLSRTGAVVRWQSQQSSKPNFTRYMQTGGLHLYDLFCFAPQWFDASSRGTPSTRCSTSTTPSERASASPTVTRATPTPRPMSPSTCTGARRPAVGFWQPEPKTTVAIWCLQCVQCVKRKSKRYIGVFWGRVSVFPRQNERGYCGRRKKVFFVS